MTKKTLIELMLENDVSWPDGAEFAVQGCKTNRALFSSIKPAYLRRIKCWCSEGFMPDEVQLPELSRNWHQTVVTREQYEAAQVRKSAAKRFSPNRIVDTDMKVVDLMKPRTLDAIIANIKECDDKINHHSAELATYTEGRAKFVDELNEMLAGVGMMVVDNTVPSGIVIKTTGEELHTEHPEYEAAKPSQWPDYCDENGIVTGCWSRLPVGARVECISSKGSYVFYPGKIYEVGKDKRRGITGPLDEDGETSNSDTSMSFTKFRLIK